MSILGQQIPKPQDWQAFERLCFALYQRIWADPNAQMNGRSGQKQAGVDVYGHDREGRFTGVQCKGKNSGYGSALTDAELRREVRAAKGFTPALDVFILATSAPNDATLQKIAREITTEHKKEGLFEVIVTGWDTLSQRVAEFPDIARTHFSSIAYTTILEDSQNKHSEILDVIARLHADMVARLPVSPVDAAAAGDAADEPLRSRIKDAIELSNGGQSRAAITILERLRASEWEAASPRNRYRLLNALGFAHVALNEVAEGVALLRAAHDADLGKPWSLVALAFASLFAEEPERGFEAAREALTTDPTLEAAAPALIHLAPLAMSITELTELIPAELQSKAQTLLALSSAAHKRGDSAEALKQAEAAYAAEPADWRTRSVLAHELLTPILARRSIGLTRLLGAAEKADFEKGLSLLRQAWTEVAANDFGARCSEIALNLSFALVVAGDEDGASRVVDEGLRLNPDSGPLLRRKAILLAEKDDWIGARDILAKVPEQDLDPEARIFAARTRLATGDVEGARAEANRIWTELAPSRVRDMASALRLEADLALGAGIDGLLTAWEKEPNSVLLRMVGIGLAKEGGPVRDRLLADLAEIVKGESDERDIGLAAVAYRALGEPSRAADLLHTLTPTDRDTPLLLERLAALVAADRRKEARELFEQLPPEVRNLRPYVDLGVQIYDKIGRLDRARDCVSAHLSRHPDDLRARLVWLGISERMRDSDEARAWLKTVDPRISGDPRSLMALAHAIDHLLADQRALEIGYRALRAGYHDPNIHLGYSLGLFLFGQAVRGRSMSPKAVGPNTAVLLSRVDGAGGFARIIETEPEPRIEREEIAPTDQLGRQLIGLQVGAEITVRDMIAGEVRYRVQEIRDKYLHAHFAVLQGFEVRFPGNTAFGSMHIREDDPNKFDDMFRIARERGKQGLELADRYREGALPLAVIGKVSGTRLFDLWDDLSKRPEMSILCAMGNEAERELASQNLADAKVCVLDPLAAYAAVALGIDHTLMAAFPSFAVTQSTVDLFGDVVDERRRDCTGGRMGTFGWNGEHYFMLEATPSQLQERADVAERALKFVLRLPIVPAEANNALSSGASQLLGILPRAHRDAILAASAPGNVLLCEDGPLRWMAEGVAGVKGAWMQSVLRHGVASEKIELEPYWEAVGCLVDAGHHFTSFGWTEVIYELRRHNWVPIGRVPEYFRLLAMSEKNADQVCEVVAEIWRFAWQGTRADHRFRAILWSMLSAFRKAQPDALSGLVDRWLQRRYEEVLLLASQHLRPDLMGTTSLKKAGPSASAAAIARRHADRLSMLIEEYRKHAPHHA